MLSARLLALALLVVAAACGNSREEREFDRVAEQCRGLVARGATLGDAAQTFPLSGGYPIAVGPACNSQLVRMGGGNDTCPPSTAENPQCQVFLYWYPVDPGLCEPTGCWLVCEMRVMRQDPAWGDTGEPRDAKICASRFLRGMPTP